jgi:epoxyqueuosine reductase
MQQGLIDLFRVNGERGAAVPFSRVDDLKRDMLELKAGDYHTHWLDRMIKHMTSEENQFNPDKLSFKARSLISVTMPGPKVLLRFMYHGKPLQCVVPPHYTDWEKNNMRVLDYLRDYLRPFGYSAEIFETVTQKLLAAHCGLVRYGRNNIAYSDEFGSYFQIMTYVSDMPCDVAEWFPVRRMELCDMCNACVEACPTNAIDPTRRLVNADRCITAVNESPGEFPEWLATDAHNSIVGCTMCQDCCPANAFNKDNVKDGVEFTEEETVELLNHERDTPYSIPLDKKLEATGLGRFFTYCFPRNLKALMQKSE